MSVTSNPEQSTKASQETLKLSGAERLLQEVLELDWQLGVFARFENGLAISAQDYETHPTIPGELVQVRHSIVVIADGLYLGAAFGISPDKYLSGEKDPSIEQWDSLHNLSLDSQPLPPPPDLGVRLSDIARAKNALSLRQNLYTPPQRGEVIGLSRDLLLSPGSRPFDPFFFASGTEAETFATQIGQYRQASGFGERNFRQLLASQTL